VFVVKTVQFFILTFFCGLSVTSYSSTAKAITNKVDQTEEIFLAKISTDYVKKSYDLSLRLNSQKLITAILTKNNKKNKTKVYGVSVLNKPIILVKAVGIELISLKCDNFATSRGCDITIEYPYNLTYGKFKKFNAKLLKVDGKWRLTDQNNKQFNELFLQAKKVLGVLIGIKRIVPGMKK
jgi:hypothetical protein